MRHFWRLGRYSGARVTTHPLFLGSERRGKGRSVLLLFGDLEIVGRSFEIPSKHLTPEGSVDYYYYYYDDDDDDDDDYYYYLSYLISGVKHTVLAAEIW